MNATARATHVRWMMLGFVVLIMLVDSLDRAVMGIAGKGIQDELSLGTQTMGWVLSAYTLGYALFQLPWGYAGDRFGPRRILLLAVVWSSLSTAITVAISMLRSGAWLSPVRFLFVVRFLVGVGVAAGGAQPQQGRRQVDEHHRTRDRQQLYFYWRRRCRNRCTDCLCVPDGGVGLAPAFLLVRGGWIADCHRLDSVLAGRSRAASRDQ